LARERGGVGWGGGGDPSVTVCIEIVDETHFSVSVFPNVVSISGCCKFKCNEE
jgi:hypothetical protein